MSGIIDTWGGSIVGKVLTFNPDAMPKPDTLHISMTRGERRIADELHKEFGGFERVVIDVDGEQHEFNADGFIRLLESYERAQGTNNHMRLFGTPERAARTLYGIKCGEKSCKGCPIAEPCAECDVMHDDGESLRAALLEWLGGVDE